MEELIPEPAKDGESDMLSLLKRASLEWRNKYNIACLRLDSIWNDAVYDCMDALGDEHYPVHDDNLCNPCWMHKQLIPVLRLDHPPYVPMKERMMHKLGELEYLAGFMPVEAQVPYLQGLSDARIVVEDMLDDRL
jgi:hypothetical protein